MEKGPLCDLWVDQSYRALELLARFYGFTKVDIHAGPLTAVDSVNVSWVVGGRLSYISFALPEGETRRQEHARALRDSWYRGHQ